MVDEEGHFFDKLKRHKTAYKARPGIVYLQEIAVFGDYLLGSSQIIVHLNGIELSVE